MKLYEISSEYQNALENLFDDEGVINETELKNMEKAQTDVQEKGIAIAQFISNMNADVDALKSERERLARRQTAIENRMKWMNEYLKSNMERCGIKEISCPYFSIKVQKSQPAVCIDDKQSIPEEYLRKKTVVEPDKIKMRDDLKNGVSIPGAQLVYGSFLSIK